MNNTEILYEVQGLSRYFPSKRGVVKAVDDVSFQIRKGETFSLVGESGCGKSVLCKTIMKLLPATAQIREGSILVNGTDISKYTEKEMQRLRGKLFAMVFQDPMTALNPTMTIGVQIAEAVLAHKPKLEKSAVRARVIELLELVGIDRAQERMALYPHNFSGGMRQRAALIRTLALKPELLLLDEPFSALDYQTRLNVSDDIGKILKQEKKTAILVTHDISEAISMADRVLILSRRPASVVKIVPIDLDMEERTPLASRNAPAFKSYFTLIVKSYQSISILKTVPRCLPEMHPISNSTLISSGRS